MIPHIKKENGTIGFWTRPQLHVFWTLHQPTTSGSKLNPYVGKLVEECISITKDSIQPQVPLRLPCYEFTPVKYPTVVCTNKTTKCLCGASVPQKSWVIIGPMLLAKPIPRHVCGPTYKGHVDLTSSPTSSIFGGFHLQPDSPSTCPLCPVISKNTCPPDLTAAAGTELA
ncbi:hypothetical protein H5410_028055 [Solanum commersonii]|uniref:Uncharacterized protein n=1 Tax=Solanum commersonii TaxID=4109 RepID=A0A9J5Z0V6_SOLCO|nr:hypothetical protein H5410_028055 [Solanum commersonii]